MLRDDELALMYEGINRYLDDYQREVTTRDEMVMIFSLEYKLARPSEVKRMIDQMLKEGYLVESGEYIRLTEVNMDPKTSRYSVPGGKKWKPKVKKADQKPKAGPKAKPKAAPRRESAWDVFRRTKIEDEPMYEPDEGEYYEDELSASYDEYLGSTYPYEVQQKMRRRKTPIRGRGYMMIPDDGTGHVPASIALDLGDLFAWTLSR